MKARRKRSDGFDKSALMELTPTREQGRRHRDADAGAEVAHRVDQRRRIAAFAGGQSGIRNRRDRDKKQGESDGLENARQSHMRKADGGVKAAQMIASE